MLEISDVSLRFEEKQVLDRCSLRLERGERVALMGPSGCGKTSLLRVALSLQKPDSGAVVCRALRTAAVFQEPRLLPWLTAAENVNLVLSDRRDTLPRAQEWLRKLELYDARGLCPAELSGGMRQRLALARALAAEADLLVLDEAFKAMDDALHDRVLRLVRASTADAALLIATHSTEEARALGCRILRYSDGRFEPARGG